MPFRTSAAFCRGFPPLGGKLFSTLYSVSLKCFVKSQRCRYDRYPAKIDSQQDQSPGRACRLSSELQKTEKELLRGACEPVHYKSCKWGVLHHD